MPAEDAAAPPAKPGRVGRALRVAAELSPKDILLARRLRALGIAMPVRCVVAARRAKLPLPMACALLTMETSGGRNVFGHDDSIFKGAGNVTKELYLAYRAERDRTRKMQGVGPTQLTWHTLQDEADKLGGCWDPLANMQVGFGHLAQLVRRNGIRVGARAYNGSGEAAERYADKFMEHYERFKAELGAPVEPPAPVEPAQPS